jgi:heme/copper-type cytochrome/quinol oxidase subunit 4
MHPILSTTCEVSNNGFWYFFAQIRIVTLIACLGMLFASEAIEAITLRDGRVLTGAFDEKAGKILIKTGDLSAWVSVPTDQITNRVTIQPAARERTAAYERIAAEEIAAKQRQEEQRQRLLEFEAAAAAKRQAKEQREAAAAADLAKVERERAAAVKAKEDEERRQREETAQRQRAAERAAEAARQAKALEIERQQRMEYQAEQNKREMERQGLQAKESEDETKDNEFNEAFFTLMGVIIGFILFVFITFAPLLISIFRSHKFILQIAIINILLPLGLGIFLKESVLNLTPLISVAILMPAWIGCLVWATWPGLSQPKLTPAAPTGPRRRIPPPRPEPKP